MELCESNGGPGHSTAAMGRFFSVGAGALAGGTRCSPRLRQRVARPAPGCGRSRTLLERQPFIHHTREEPQGGNPVSCEWVSYVWVGCMVRLPEDAGWGGEFARFAGGADHGMERS